MLTARNPEIVDAFQAFVAYDEHHVLPAAGALYDQSATLMDAWEHARHERGEIERERAEEEARKRERQEKLAGNGKHVRSGGW